MESPNTRAVDEPPAVTQLLSTKSFSSYHVLFAILVLFYLSVLFASGFCFAVIGSVLIPFVWSTISLCNYHEYFVASSVTTPYFCCIFYKMHTWSTGILKIAQMGDIQRDTFLRHS